MKMIEIRWYVEGIEKKIKEKRLDKDVKIMIDDGMNVEDLERKNRKKIDDY